MIDKTVVISFYILSVFHLFRLYLAIVKKFWNQLLTSFILRVLSRLGFSSSLYVIIYVFFHSVILSFPSAQ
jgi:hypothetical protein